jgi:hypothetical protein
MLHGQHRAAHKQRALAVMGIRPHPLLQQRFALGPARREARATGWNCGSVIHAAFLVCKRGAI